MKTRILLAFLALLSLPLAAHAFGDPPEACFEITVQNCFFTVCFDASCSTDDNGIWQYKWFFGDGASGSGETICHKFPDEGEYNVQLLVWDGPPLQGGDGDLTQQSAFPTDCSS